MTDYSKVLQVLKSAKVDFILIGGVALERLIQLKRAAGRPKDFEAIAELQALLEERRKKSGEHPSS
jgi:predicted nucleotidyltransferase